MDKPYRFLALIPAGAVVFVFGHPILRWLRCFWPALPGFVFWPLAALLFCSVMLSYMLPYGRLSSALHLLGEALMPVNLLSAALILPAELLRLIWRSMPVREVGFILLGIFAAAAAAGIRNAFRVKVRRYPVLSETSCGAVRLVLLSDLHLGAFTDRNLTKRLADAVCREAPELVILAGDLFDDRFEALRHPGRHAEELRRMAELCPVLACEGNHDLFAPTPERERFLEEAGIRILRDESVLLNGLRFVFRRDIRVPDRKSAEELLDGPGAGGEPIIAVDHNPAETRALWKAGADAVLSGHTHGGQSFPGNLLYRLSGMFWYGMKRDGGHCSVVTSGAGFYGIPLRLGTDTEIAVIEIGAAEKRPL